MSETERTGVDWPELAVAVLRTGLMLTVVVMADPTLRFEAMIRAEKILKWWNGRRGVLLADPSPPPASPPAVSALLEEARGIVRDSSMREAP